MNRLSTFLFITLIALLWSCTPSKTESAQEGPKTVRIETNFGNIVIQLYDETPQHRDNFLKLVDDQFYDSILFHRVVPTHVIQAGDPNSKTATIEDTVGLGDLPYTLPAEFHPDIFHKRGAVGAARDNNPQRASSSTQFYIVQGLVYNDSTLELQLDRINGWLAMNRVVNDPANKAMLEELDSLKDANGDSSTIQMMEEQLQRMADENQAKTNPYKYPEAHREHYKTYGGRAYLDQNYTVFGEVIEGMEVVDHIMEVETNDMDRPLEPVRILSAKVID